MTTQFPVILSPALQRERDAPEHLSKQLVCDDIEVYITRLKPQSSGWAMLYCKSLNCIMVLDYNNITGVGLSFETKPSKVCGTGFCCLDEGLRSITRNDFYSSCRKGWSRFYTEGRDAKLYAGPNEYFDSHSYAQFDRVLAAEI